MRSEYKTLAALALIKNRHSAHDQVRMFQEAISGLDTYEYSIIESVLGYDDLKICRKLRQTPSNTEDSPITINYLPISIFTKEINESENELIISTELTKSMCKRISDAYKDINLEARVIPKLLPIEFIDSKSFLESNKELYSIFESIPSITGNLNSVSVKLGSLLIDIIQDNEKDIFLNSTCVNNYLVACIVKKKQNETPQNTLSISETIKIGREIGDIYSTIVPKTSCFLMPSTQFGFGDISSQILNICAFVDRFDDMRTLQISNDTSPLSEKLHLTSHLSSETSEISVSLNGSQQKVRELQLSSIVNIPNFQESWGFFTDLKSYLSKAIPDIALSVEKK